MLDSVLTIGLSPAFERILVFDDFTPGRVNRAKEKYIFASGKALNVTRVLKMLNRDCVNLTFLSKENGELFLSLAEKEGLCIKALSSSTRNRTCTTIIDRNKREATELVEESEEVEESLSNQILELFKEEVKHHSALVLSGTKAPGLSDSLIPEIVKESRERGLMTILDIKGKDLKESLKYSPSLIKPNLFEFSSTFGLAYSGDDDNETKRDVERIMRDIYAEYHTMTIISRGSSSILSYDGDNFCETKVEKVEAINPIGCGDTLTAAVTHALLEGKTLKKAIEYGSVLASRKALSQTFIFEL